jgi:hypothetical protein
MIKIPITRRAYHVTKNTGNSSTDPVLFEVV